MNTDSGIVDAKALTTSVPIPISNKRELPPR